MSRLAWLSLLTIVGVPLAFLGVAFVFFSISFKTYVQPSISMMPTIKRHDVLLANRFSYVGGVPKDGDVVVFDPPIETINPFVKRIVARPGETLHIRGGTVHRNGVPLVEPYVSEKTDYEFEIKDYGIYVDGSALDQRAANIPPRRIWTSPYSVPPGCYVLLGDNRANSEDSHVWGFAQSDETFWSGSAAGRFARSFQQAVFILYPESRTL